MEKVRNLVFKPLIKNNDFVLVELCYLVNRNAQYFQQVNYYWGQITKHLSKNQQQILQFLEIKPEMTTKEIAETLLGKIVEYNSKDYSSVSRSLRSMERQGFVKRVQVKLRWRLNPYHADPN